LIRLAQFYTSAENASKAMAPALKILADPVADPAAKEEAQKTVRQLRAFVEDAAKRAGVDLRVPQAQAHAEARASLKAGAKLDEVNKRLEEGGYEPLPPVVPVAPTKTADQSQQVLTPPSDAHRWVMNKLMEFGDGPDKLLEISRTNANPAFRQAAKELYEAFKAKQDAVDPGLYSGGL
jgi:hypothetical protein